ncbi:MAG: YcxB family protein [Pseudomonadota bacterium]
MIEGASALSVTGKLSEKDVKRLTDEMRGSTIGPTTLYYAGVTAPVIGAGMALLTKEAFNQIGMDPYWKVMLSAIIAAMAGIVWYLIFVRWSYRHNHGRSGEMDQGSTIALTERYISIRRGLVETRMDWKAVKDVKLASDYTLIKFDGAEPVIVPDGWFGDDIRGLSAFRRRLKKG